MLDYVILGMVLDDDLTGYDIKKCIESGIGVFYRASYGSLYPALRRLEQQGQLTMYEQPQGNRRKNFYRITDQGRRRFLDWLASPMEVLDGQNTHLAKVYFFDALPPELRDRQLLEHETNNRNYLKKLLALEREFAEIEEQSGFYHKLSTLYYGICATQASIRWCEHVRAGKPLAELIEAEG